MHGPVAQRPPSTAAEVARPPGYFTTVVLLRPPRPARPASTAIKMITTSATPPIASHIGWVYQDVLFSLTWTVTFGFCSAAINAIVGNRMSRSLKVSPEMSLHGAGCGRPMLRIPAINA